MNKKIPPLSLILAIAILSSFHASFTNSFVSASSVEITSIPSNGGFNTEALHFNHQALQEGSLDKQEVVTQSVQLPDFKLPYPDTATIYWTGGPHQFGNGDSSGKFPSGTGSGLDFAGGIDTDSETGIAYGVNFRVLAIASGIIEDKQNTNCDATKGFGCWIAIRHDIGGSVVVYAHLKPGTLFNKSVGEHVDQGEWIAQAGSSGQQVDQNGNPVPHLHLELRRGGQCSNSNNCFFGDPLGWDDLVPAFDGYHIGSFLADGEGLQAYNYDGSAVWGNSVKIVENFPFLDNGSKQKAIVRVHSSFQCNTSATTCEDNSQGRTTQFAGGSALLGGNSQSEETLSWVQATSTSSPGKLLSSNKPRVSGQVSNLDSALFLSDRTLPDGSVIGPGQTPTKTWRMRNTGQTTWGSGYQLVFRDGNRLGAPNAINVPTTAPGAEVDLSVRLQIPGDISPGTYKGQWQLRNPGGTYFGPLIWFSLVVPNGQPPTGNASGVELVRINSPSSVSLGQRFQPEITVRVNSGELRQDRGDMLRPIANNYSDFPHVAVQGRVSNGQEYTFRFYDDHPMVAPAGSGTYESRWRVWANGGYVGPEIVIRFGVYQQGASRPPNKPSLVSPGDWGVYYAGDNPTLCARANGDPDGDPVNEYYFDIYDSGQLWNSGWVSSSCFTAQGLAAFGYQWRVKVRDSHNVESEWSDTWRFNIYSTNFTISEFRFDPPSPSNASLVKVYVTIQGNGGHAWRRLMVNTATDGSGNGEWRELAGWLDYPTMMANWEPFHLAEGQHRVRLEVKRFESDTNIVIEDRIYTVTRGVPSRPVLLNPSRNFWSGERTITFRWKPSLRATGYTLYVGTADDPRQSPIVQVSLSGIEYTHTFTQDYGRLNWRVDATNEIGVMDQDLPGWFGIDQVSPVSAVNTQRTPSLSYENQFAVSWDGSDNASGIHTYDVQVRSLPDGQWTDWLTGYPYASAIFNGQPGRTYEFRTRARDIAGNVEPYPTNPDVSVRIDPAHRPPLAWWNNTYAAKRTVVVSNRMADGVLPAAYPVLLHFDSSTTPTASEIYNGSVSAQKGDDVRLVFNDQTELARQILTFSPTAVDIWFPAAADIPAGGSSNSYSLYYGNAQATNPGYQATDVFQPRVDPNTRLLLSFNEGSGSSVADASGNGNNGTLSGNFAQPWPQGRFWSGLSFDGASQVLIPDSPSQRFGNQITVEAWVRPTVIDNRTRNIVSKISSTAGSAFRILLRDGYPLFIVSVEGGEYGAVSSLRLNANQWYHVAGIYDGRFVRIWVDGVERGWVYANGNAIRPSSATLMVGDTTYGGELFIGDIDQVKISAAALTSFPYAKVSVDPAAAAGAELRPVTVGATDVVIQSLETSPNPGGGILVQATLKNQGAFPTYNEFFVHLYGNHTPTGPGDLSNGVGFWVNAPIAAGETITLTTVLAETAIPALASVQATPAADQTFDLAAQVDSLGALNDSNRSNNILSGPQVCLASADSFEGDDTTAQAKPIQLGQPQTHTFDKVDDLDWVRFEATAGTTYILRTFALGTSADTQIALYSQDGTTLLASNDDYGDALASQIEWTAPASGSYYLQVRHWNPNAGGCGTSYKLSVSTKIEQIFLPFVRR